jgi:CubicO group peptidase (beta-lactamase class C family)
LRVRASSSAIACSADRARIDAARACEPDSAVLQLVPVELVDARADRLDEPKASSAIEQGVAPQPRHDHDVGVADSPLEVVRGADLEAVDRHLPMTETRLKLIGDVSKANGQTLAAWQH